jgi:cytochrome c-type biogenesis protein CcmE
MTRKSRRMAILAACMIGLGSATALSLSAFSSDMVFFVAPSDMAEKGLPGRSLRLGGLVEAGTVHRETEDGEPVAHFRITDGRADVAVAYRGILPDLFREGQGIVALGSIGRDGVFRASEVLAKHDETYMPKDVADALKKAGMWDPSKGPPPPASTWNAAVTKSAG